MHRSKTYQSGRGAEVELGPCGQTELCLITALWAYVYVRGSEPGFLFLHWSGDPLTQH